MQGGPCSGDCLRRCGRNRPTGGKDVRPVGRTEIRDSSGHNISVIAIGIAEVFAFDRHLLWFAATGVQHVKTHLCPRHTTIITIATNTMHTICGADNFIFLWPTRIPRLNRATICSISTHHLRQ